jgi:hypothetical protein
MLGVLLVAALVGCESLASGPAALDRRAGEEGALRAEATASALRLTNTGGATIHFFAIDAETATLALWAPCTDPVSCPRLPPRARRDVGWPQVAGYRADREGPVLVYWWHLVADGRGAFAPDSLRVVPVRR